MITTDSFHIITLQADDAKSLSEMMVLNFDNFKRYFPITLSKNQSFDDSLKYIEEKRKENDLKSEFTFGIKDISNSIDIDFTSFDFKIIEVDFVNNSIASGTIEGGYKNIPTELLPNNIKAPLVINSKPPNLLIGTYIKKNWRVILSSILVGCVVWYVIEKQNKKSKLQLKN